MKHDPTMSRIFSLRNRLQNIINRMAKELASVKQRLAETEQDIIKSLARSLELSAYNDVPVDELAGKFIIQCCVLIAKRNCNRLRTTPARCLMIKAGVLGQKSASSVLFTIINRSKLFKKFKHGEYDYVGEGD